MTRFDHQIEFEEEVVSLEDLIGISISFFTTMMLIPLTGLFTV